MASFRARALLGVLVAVAALWAVLFARDRRRATEVANAPRPPTVAEHYRLEWPWKTESEWIVSDITGALVNMGGQGAAPAGRMPVTPPREPLLAHFDVAVRSSPPVPIDITDHIWAPATYAPFAATIVGPAGPPCAAPGEASLVEALLTPTVGVLQRENARISAALKDSMRCGGVHEQAALLVAAFALRESAGHFNDPRRLMSRMAAHLAFATALEGTSDRPARRLAEATLLTLAVRQQSALEALGRFETPTAAPSLQAWARALRARNTADWRPIEAVSRPSLLEMLAAIRATETSVGDDYTWKVMEQFGDMPNVPDVGRVLLVLSPGVFAGNRYAASNIVLETAEAAAARTTFDPAFVANAPDDLVKVLNAEPERGPVGADGAVWVLDWGTWAAASQRHLLMAVTAYEAHVENGLAIKGGAKEFRDETVRSLSGLRLYPTAAWLLASDKEEYNRAMVASIELARTRPDMISAWMWKCLHSSVKDYGPPPPSVPPDLPWFTPLFPPGTAFDTDNRPYTTGNRLRMPVGELQRLKTVAPYARSLPYAILRQLYPDNHPTADQIRAEVGPLGTYDLYFVNELARASRGNFTEYTRIMEAAAQFDPNYLAYLANRYADWGRSDEALRLYQRWLATTHNEIAVSAYAWPLLHHYVQTGACTRGRELADRVADVYSGAGLISAAEFYDACGDVNRAEGLQRAAYERYDAPADYLGFLVRHNRSADVRQGLLWRVFPAGMQRVTLVSLVKAPDEGVTLNEVGETGRRCGLADGDIVVAVDGIAVRNYWHYRVARGASAGDSMRFTLWRANRYFEVEAPLRNFWPISTLTAFTRAPAARRP